MQGLQVQQDGLPAGVPGQPGRAVPEVRRPAEHAAGRSRYHPHQTCQVLPHRPDLLRPGPRGPLAAEG